ncbi:response regulator transcription factor [Aromatoleum diolicum]|uniref:Response regulator n=1 Tax=Aromatoleum diolicum TaxID=75796 RepID=A0ABX1QDQ6_9RHOO|nr:response regulator [Aromatoleum diolicum]NMG76125.1 response regulator [Aromatoleum diolicum]
MHTTTPSGSVCIVDDDEQVRRFLVEVFTSVGVNADAFPCGERFMQTWRPVGATCVLLDLCMPRVTGCEVHDWLRAAHPQVPVIFLTGFADVPTAVSAMRLGAFDFLEKPFDIQHLIERAQDALRTFSGRAAGGCAANAAWLRTLTPREREVLDGIVAGRRNKTIASELGISERTVETHRANIMQKSGTRSVAELVAVALAHNTGP